MSFPFVSQQRVFVLPAAAFVMVVVVCGVLLMIGLSVLGYHVQQHQHQAVREARFDFGLHQIKTSFEAGLRLGLSPSDVPLTQQRIDKMQSEQPDILSIDIFDAQGRVLFSTDVAGLGASMAGAWWQGCLHPSRPELKGQDADSQWQCRSLIDGFDMPTAGVVLRHRLNPPMLSERWQSAHTWLMWGVAVGALILAGTIGWSVAKPLHALLSEWCIPLLANSQGMLTSDKTKASMSSLPKTWAVGIAAWHVLHTELAQAEMEAERIDQMEVG